MKGAWRYCEYGASLSECSFAISDLDIQRYINHGHTFHICDRFFVTLVYMSEENYYDPPIVGYSFYLALMRK